MRLVCVLLQATGGHDSSFVLEGRAGAKEVVRPWTSSASVRRMQASGNFVPGPPCNAVTLSDRGWRIFNVLAHAGTVMPITVNAVLPRAPVR